MVPPTDTDERLRELEIARAVHDQVLNDHDQVLKDIRLHLGELVKQFTGFKTQVLIGAVVIALGKEADRIISLFA